VERDPRQLLHQVLERAVAVAHALLAVERVDRRVRVPAGRPEVWRSRSRTLGSRSGSSSTSPSSDSPAKTRSPRSSGTNFETRSSSPKRPSSHSIIAATLAIGLVIEWMRKIASVRIGRPASRSAMPTASSCARRPRRAIAVTTPASFPSST
jgi:hypothetical protein